MLTFWMENRTQGQPSRQRKKPQQTQKASSTKGLVTVTRNPHTQPLSPTPPGICLWARLELFKFCGAADSAVQVSLDLFHSVPDPEQSCLTDEPHKLISVIKADKIPFSSIQRSLFFQLFTPQPTLLCSRYLPACLQETANDFLFSLNL